MKMISKHAMLYALSAGLLCASCQLEDYDVPAEELYARQFIKKFGVFDKNQDWNLAERKTVTVNPGSATQVKVYAYVGDTKYIFADYSNVEGTQTLEFDLPEGVEDIIVSVNGVEKTAKVGETVDFSSAGTRAATESDNGVVAVEKTGVYKEFEHDELVRFHAELPEEVNNKDKFTQNFLYTSNGPFTLYPIYWYTQNTPEIGVYYYDDAGEEVKTYKKDGDIISPDSKVKITRVPFYTIKSGDELQYKEKTKDATSGTPEASINYGNYGGYGITFEEVDNEYLYTWTAKYGHNMPEDVKNTDFNAFSSEQRQTFEQYLIKELNWGESNIGAVIAKCVIYWDDATADKLPFKLYKAGTEGTPAEYGEWTDDMLSRPSDGYLFDGEKFTATYLKEDPLFRSQGIKISVEEGRSFGLYLKADGYYMYSELALNSDFDNHFVTLGNGTLEIDEETGEPFFYIGMEDWYGGGNDHDLNDLMFRLYGSDNLPTPKDEDKPEPEPGPDPDAYSWILAAEDLGNLDDFDFNDVVVEVKHIAGQTTAEVTALAAGGTLPIYLCRDGEMIDGEFHSWFGDGSYPSTTMINTGAGPNAPGKTVTIQVSADFSMAHNVSEVENGNMGGFSIKVERADGTYSKVKAPAGSDAQIEAPQMLCLPCGWNWPKERTGIHVAYSLFNDWCKDHNCNNWHETPNTGCLYRK